MQGQSALGPGTRWEAACTVAKETYKERQLWDRREVMFACQMSKGPVVGK